MATSEASSTTSLSIKVPDQGDLAEFGKKIVAAKNEDMKATILQEVMTLFGRNKGVIAVMLMTRSGCVIASNFDKSTTGMYCGISTQIIQTMIPTIEKSSGNPSPVRLIRVNSLLQEILLAPIDGEDFVFVIVQNPQDSASIASSSNKEVRKNFPAFPEL